MNTTPGLGSFNKDKVANKFGIQLKPKDTNKQSQPPLSPLNERKTIHTETSSVTKNQTVSDFRVQNESNGFQTNTNITKHSTSSKTPQSIGNSTKSKSTIELVSTSMNNERRDSLTSNVNHSTSLKPVKSTLSIESLSKSSSSSNILLLSKSPETVKRSSLTPISTDRQSILTSKDRSISPKPSIKSQNIPTGTTKSVAEIEHQKDQPLYKRQLSKTLDNATSIANKSKHQHELIATSTIASKR
jgi:hypothetical protein